MKTREAARISNALSNQKKKPRSLENVKTIHQAMITVLQPKQQAKLRCNKRVSPIKKMTTWSMFLLNFKEMVANVKQNATKPIASSQEMKWI